MHVKSILFCLYLFASSFLVGQEFNINVNVSSPQSITIDQSLFKDLEGKIYEFYNNTQWTEDEFRDVERIDGQITITVVKEVSANSFVADILIQTRRPVYQSNYNTTLLNHFDKGVEITYNPGQPINRSDVSYYDNLSSILTFYAYIMLGYDYDSFSPLGGEEHFIKARDIISTLPSSVLTSAGWDNRGGIVGRNRYWLQENLLNPKMKPFRQFWYEYHRLGLDEFYNDADRQRAIIASGISGLQDVIKDYPSSMVLQLFSDAKHMELVEIFTIADRGQKRKVYDIMIQADPAQAERYKELSQ